MHLSKICRVYIARVFLHNACISEFCCNEQHCKILDVSLIGGIVFVESVISSSKGKLRSSYMIIDFYIFYKINDITSIAKHELKGNFFFRREKAVLTVAVTCSRNG